MSNDLADLLKKHYVSRTTITAEVSHKKPTEGESIAEYIANFRKMDSVCNFGYF